MNELQVSEKYSTAVELHRKIMTSGQIVASALVDFCAELKEMRDRELYAELGYDDFDSYVEGAVGIKRRQAYNYIQAYEKNGRTVMEENAGLGITKLQLIAQFSVSDRAEILESGELAEMSAAEVKALVAEKNSAIQQLGLLQEENKELSEKVKAAETEMAAGTVEVSEPFYTAQDIEAAEKKAAEAALSDIAAAHKKEIVEIKKKALADAEAANQKKLEAARKAAVEEGKKAAAEANTLATEQLRKEAKRAAEEKAAAEQRVAQLEKELKVAGSKETTQFMVLFDQLQQTQQKMQETLEVMRQNGQAEQADKLAGALKKALDAICQAVK